MIADAFQLHSLPGCANVIYIDCKGKNITGTAWNSGYSIPTIVASPMNTEGDANTYTAYELAQIKDIWARVAEDYKPFNVDVTTQEPTGAYNTWGATILHAIVTFGTASTPAGTTSGGIAYVGVFGLGSSTASYRPAFIYHNNLANDTKCIAEAISHEIGHNFGLSHDGVTGGDAYFSGVGTGASGWAPIMGAGYYKAVTQWSKGEYTGANNLEDDISIISGKLGYVTAPATTFTAGTQSGCSAYYTGTGIIRTAGETQTWNLNVPTGGAYVQIVAKPWYSSWSPSNVVYNGNNLDIQLTAYGSTVNPTGDPSAALTLPAVPSGNLAISLSSSGDSSTPYSTYGSAGYYTISACVNSTKPTTCTSGTCCNLATGYVSTVGTVCRLASGTCDAAETCDGISPNCPSDSKLPSGTVCSAAVGPCDIAEVCDGVSATCPTANAIRPSGYVCRASAGACDVAETCNGTSTACPADTFIAANVVCRTSVGTCDLAETCTGNSAACPTDIFAGTSVLCRAAVYGGCDVAEYCTGKSGTCPTDSFAASTIVCRAAAGPCDLVEKCPGTSATCPPDRLQSSTYVCRVASSTNKCDQKDYCTGTTVTCRDTFLANGTKCGSGAKTCKGGVCM